MKRARLLPLVLTLAGLALLMYIVVGLYVPSARNLTLGVDKGTGRIRVVNQQITFLPWHKYYLLQFEKRQGSAQTNGLIRITSREGVPVKMTYRLRFGFATNRLPDARRLINDGWSAWLRTRVAEAVSAVTAQVPIEQFATPTSAFSRQRAALRQVVARHLAQSGLIVTAFEIEQMEVDRDALLKYKRAELRRNARGTFGRVAVFGIDGADWELLTELMIDNRVPNIKALVNGGVSGTMVSIQPTVSPLVWATMETGLSPDRHGILDFFDPRQRNTPADSRTRMAPAVWEIGEAFGRSSTVADWWTAWPPSTSGAYVSTPVQLLPAAAAPADIAQRTAANIIPENTVGVQQLARFLNLTQSEFDDALNSNDEQNPAVLFRATLAKTWSDHRRALAAYQATRPVVMMMNYEGTDVVNHLFGPYHPPYREGVSEVEFRKYWKTVAEYYAEVDRLIGEWMRVLPPDTTVMIVSAHGMKWGKDRPKMPPRGRSALSDHRGTGVFIAFGQHVLPNRLRRPISIYDIAPTILSLIGLPKAAEMPGQPATWAFRDLQVISGVNIGSYHDLIVRKPLPTAAAVDPRLYRSRLVAIGHVVDPNSVSMPLTEEDENGGPKAAPLPPEKWGEYAFLNNQAIQLKKEKKYKEAVESLQAAIDRNPNRPTPYFNLAALLIERQQFSAAEDVFVKALSLGVPNPDRYLIDFAAYYRAHDMPTRAINLLLRGRQLFPQSYLVAANLGSALAASKRYTDAGPELERALAMQPSSTLVLNDLGMLSVKREDYGRALDYWNRSLAIDPRQPQIREAVNAVRSRL